MAGAFILSRDIFENAIWQNIIEFRLFVLVVGKAIWKEDGLDIGGLHLNKGQWLRSYRNLQSDLEYIENNAIKRPSLSTIKRAIDDLVSANKITVCDTKLGTLFTVVDYCKDQDFKSYKPDTANTAKNSKRTANEQ